MYILGGDEGANSYSSQAFTLDLSVSWDSSDPPFNSLGDGPAKFYDTPSALSPDGNTWYAQTGNTAFFYDIKKSEWTILPNNITDGRILNFYPGLGATTDPDTGIIYTPNGLLSNGGKSMLKVNPDKSINSIMMPPQLAENQSSTVAWSGPLSSMIYLDESTGETYSFNSVELWKPLTINGSKPPPRSNACLVAAYGGSKMVLFGGYDLSSNKTSSDIYILDIPTLTWTVGESLNLGNGRMRAACAASGDYFIAWGGDQGQFSPEGENVNNIILPTRNTTIVYDLVANTWTTQYIAPKHPSSTKFRALIIGGSIVGSLAMVGLFGWIYYRSRQAARSIRANDKAVASNEAAAAAGEAIYVHPPPLSRYYEKRLPSIRGGRGRERDVEGGYRMSDFGNNPPTYSMSIPPKYGR
ncbi:hypothetical protein BGZ76_002011 [Entomortierella beljakovae]|nr:hypothetical protein BGZ76_002011 [Entomortierella beljakovae]